MNIDRVINYRECSRCVMDTSDPEINFNDEGVCSHCLSYENLLNIWDPKNENAEELSQIIQKIKTDGRKNDFDCILGLSGGVDSSYVALRLKEYGLRPLIVHVDAGWNSELAVYNIEKLIDYLDAELFTHVVNWNEMKSLQCAYLRSGIANQDVPQDHIFFSVLYKVASQKKIKYIISGSNYATEAIFPDAWLGDAMDSQNLKAIYKKFGSGRLKKYVTMSFWDYYIKYRFIKKIETVKPLNYIKYDKNKAIAELIEVIGYKPYPRKHGESIFTKFYQNHYLPTKFGYDKRRPHLSSMILSGQMTRANAKTILEEPLYGESELKNDLNYIAKKLSISVEELKYFITKTDKSYYNDYPNWLFKFRLLRKVYRTLRIFL